MKRILFLVLLVLPLFSAPAQDAHRTRVLDVMIDTSVTYQSPVIPLLNVDSLISVFTYTDSCHVVIDRVLCYATDTTVSAWKTTTASADSIYKTSAGYVRGALVGGGTLVSGAYGVYYIYRFQNANNQTADVATKRFYHTVTTKRLK